MLHVLKAGIAIAAFCALPMSPTAEAETPARQVSVAVSYADLDLSSLAGADAMLGRMRLAIRKICGDTPHPSQLSAGSRHRECVRSAMTRAVETLDHPVVTAAHSGRRPGAQTAAR
ncbi:MAG: UrcA family protein [Hyphomonadaceae bacterium]|nr:UrcA family protein [Hyphomonadaceae bacterium]